MCIIIKHYSSRKRPRDSPGPSELEREILMELKRDTDAERDEDDVFGLSIGSTLKKITPQQKALAKLKIQQIMYEMQFCNNQPPPNPLTIHQVISSFSCIYLFIVIMRDDFFFLLSE